MNQNKTKKGWVIFSILVCSILLLGNLTVYGKGSNPIKLNLMNGEGNPIQKQESTLKALSHILLIGLDGEGGGKDKRADSILLITLDFKRKEIIATSILRDLLVTIPGYGEDKVSAVYTYGTSKLLKETLQNELSIQIDGIMTVEYQGFINIIDELGGIEGKLTKEEAEYLQRTNYIKNPINRNIKEGVQLLNGDQALGYIRVRHVQTSDHESDDFGRTARQRDILHSIFTKSKGLTIDKMLKIMDNIQSHFKTDMNHDIMIEYLSKIMKDMHLWNFSEVTLPAKDTYKTEQRNGRFVLIPDWEANKKMLN